MPPVRNSSVSNMDNQQQQQQTAFGNRPNDNQDGTGTFERLFNALLATIVTIIFSWGLLLELEDSTGSNNKSSNKSSTEDNATAELNGSGSNIKTTKHGGTQSKVSSSTSSNSLPGASTRSDSDNEDYLELTDDKRVNMETDKIDKGPMDGSVNNESRISTDKSKDMTAATASTQRTRYGGSDDSGARTTRTTDEIRQRVRELTSSSEPSFQPLSSSPEDYYCLSSLDPDLEEHAESVLAYERFMRENDLGQGQSDATPSATSDKDAKRQSDRKFAALDLAEIERQLDGHAGEYYLMDDEMSSSSGDRYELYDRTLDTITEEDTDDLMSTDREDEAHSKSDTRSERRGKSPISDGGERHPANAKQNWEDVEFNSMMEESIVLSEDLTSEAESVRSDAADIGNMDAWDQRFVPFAQQKTVTIGPYKTIKGGPKDNIFTLKTKALPHYDVSDKTELQPKDKLLSSSDRLLLENMDTNPSNALPVFTAVSNSKSQDKTEQSGAKSTLDTSWKVPQWLEGNKTSDKPIVPPLDLNMGDDEDMIEMSNRLSDWMSQPRCRTSLSTIQSSLSGRSEENRSTVGQFEGTFQQSFESVSMADTSMDEFSVDKLRNSELKAGINLSSDRFDKKDDAQQQSQQWNLPGHTVTESMDVFESTDAVVPNVDKENTDSENRRDSGVSSPAEKESGSAEWHFKTHTYTESHDMIDDGKDTGTTNAIESGGSALWNTKTHTYTESTDLFESCEQIEDKMDSEGTAIREESALHDSTDTLLIDNELVRSIESFEEEPMDVQTVPEVEGVTETKAMRAASTEAVPPDSSSESSTSPRSLHSNGGSGEEDGKDLCVKALSNNRQGESVESPRSASSDGTWSSMSQTTTVLSPLAFAKRISSPPQIKSPTLEASPPLSSSPTPTNSPRSAFPSADSPEHSQDSTPCQSPRQEQSPLGRKPTSPSNDQNPNPQSNASGNICLNNQRLQASPPFDISYDYVECRITPDNRQNNTKPSEGQPPNKPKPPVAPKPKQSFLQNSKGTSHINNAENEVENCSPRVTVDSKQPPYVEKSIRDAIDVSQPLAITPDRATSNDGKIAKLREQRAPPTSSSSSLDNSQEQVFNWNTLQKDAELSPEDSKMSAKETGQAQSKEQGEPLLGNGVKSPPWRRSQESLSPRFVISPGSGGSSPLSRSRSQSPRSPASEKNKYTFTTTKCVSENYQVKRNQRYRSASSDSLSSDSYFDAPLDRSESDPFLLEEPLVVRSSPRAAGSMPCIANTIDKTKAEQQKPLVYQQKAAAAGNNEKPSTDSDGAAIKGLNVDPYREAYHSAGDLRPSAANNPQPSTTLEKHASDGQKRLASDHDWPSQKHVSKRKARSVSPSGLFYLGPDIAQSTPLDQSSPLARNAINEVKRGRADASPGIKPSEHETHTTGIDSLGYRLTGKGDQIERSTSSRRSPQAMASTAKMEQKQDHGQRSSLDRLASPSPDIQGEQVVVKYLSRGADKTVTAMATSTALARKEKEMTTGGDSSNSLVSAVASAEATGDNPYVAVARATARAASIASASAAREAVTTDTSDSTAPKKDITMMVSTTCTIKGDEEAKILEQAEEVVTTMGEGVEVSVHAKPTPPALRHSPKRESSMPADGGKKKLKITLENENPLSHLTESKTIECALPQVFDQKELVQTVSDAVKHILSTSEQQTQEYIMSGQGLEATIDRVARQVINAYNEAWSPQRQKLALSPQMKKKKGLSPQLPRARLMSPDNSFFYVTEDNDSLTDVQDEETVLRVIRDEPRKEILPIARDDDMPPRVMKREPKPSKRQPSPAFYYTELAVETPMDVYNRPEPRHKIKSRGQSEPAVVRRVPSYKTSEEYPAVHSQGVPYSQAINHMPPASSINTGPKPWTSALIDNVPSNVPDKTNIFKRERDRELKKAQAAPTPRPKSAPAPVKRQVLPSAIKPVVSVPQKNQPAQEKKPESKPKQAEQKSSTNTSKPTPKPREVKQNISAPSKPKPPSVPLKPSKPKEEYKSVLQEPVKDPRHPAREVKTLPQYKPPDSRQEVEVKRINFLEKDVEVKRRSRSSKSESDVARKLSTLSSKPPGYVDPQTIYRSNKSATRVDDLKKKLDRIRPAPPPKPYVETVWNAPELIAKSTETGLDRYRDNSFDRSFSPSHSIPRSSSFSSIRQDSPSLLTETDLDSTRQQDKSLSYTNLSHELQFGDLPEDFDRTQSMVAIPTPQLPRHHNEQADQSFSSRDDESIMSEHELRLSRSFDMLDIPDWYRDSHRHYEEIVPLDHAHRRDLTSDRPGSSLSNASYASSSKAVVIQHRVATPNRMRTPDSSRVSTPIGGLTDVELPSKKLRDSQKELHKIELKELHVRINADPPPLPAKEAYLKLKEEKWKNRTNPIDPVLVNEHLQALHNKDRRHHNVKSHGQTLSVAQQTIYETSPEASPGRLQTKPSQEPIRQANGNRVTFKPDDSTSDPQGDSAYASLALDSVAGSSPDAANSTATSDGPDKWYNTPPESIASEWTSPKVHSSSSFSKYTLRDKDKDKLNKEANARPIVDAVSLSTQNKPYSEEQSKELQFRSRLITSELNMRYERFDIVDKPKPKSTKEETPSKTEHGKHEKDRANMLSLNKGLNVAPVPVVDNMEISKRQAYSFQPITQQNGSLSESVSPPAYQLPSKKVSDAPRKHNIPMNVLPATKQVTDAPRKHNIPVNPVSYTKQVTEASRTHNIPVNPVPVTKQVTEASRTHKIPVNPVPLTKQVAEAPKTRNIPVNPVPVTKQVTEASRTHKIPVNPVPFTKQVTEAPKKHKIPVNVQPVTKQVTEGQKRHKIPISVLPSAKQDSDVPHKYDIPVNVIPSSASPKGIRRPLFKPHPMVEEFMELSEYDKHKDKTQMNKTDDTSLEDILDGLLGMPKVENKLMSPTEPPETPKMQAFRLLREAETPNTSRAVSMLSLNSIASNNTTSGKGTPREHDRSTFSLNKEDRDTLGNEVVMVKCRQPKCGKTTELVEAQFSYKTCHHCYTYYCSRECRKAHWERHKKKCILSKVNSQTKHIIKKAHDDLSILTELTRVARTGYLQKGRGCVMIVFSNPETADKFLDKGMAGLEVPASFTTIQELQQSDLLGDHLPEVVEMCKAYNPDVKFVLEVAIIPGEIPEGRVAPRRDRPVVYKCAKLRLGDPESIRPTEAVAMKNKVDNDTLILTAVPSPEQKAQIPGDTPAKKARELCFVNIQKKLRQRGVSLRHMFPEVYSKLCTFVADGKHFTPITLFPTDGKTGKKFMCLIMPEADADVEWMHKPDLLEELGLSTSV